MLEAAAVTHEDPTESARQAHLRYVTDAKPGIRRRKAGKGFHYVGPDGQAVRDPDTLARIKALAIPPAWMDVWICPDPRGHLQATGLDARGRKQYRYHARWRSERDAVKYDRMIAFGEALPRIRERTAEDVRRHGLPREKVLATVVRLLDETSMRIGNEEYRKQNRSFGLTTLRARHARFEGQAAVRFEFMGKSGKRHSVRVSDRRIARIVKQCQDLPGQELFQYVDEEGLRHSVESADVNEYLREISGGDFSAKDFRTWNGTVLAAGYLGACERPTSDTHGRQQVAQAIKSVATHLGNTAAVCRKSYVHPEVINAYLDGSLEPNAGVEDAATTLPEGLSHEEECVLALLRERAASTSTPPVVHTRAA